MSTMPLPTTREEILAITTIDAEFAAAIKANPSPPSAASISN
jgi:hypothetical protein